MSESAIDIERLDPEERLRLLERLWDSLTDPDVLLTDAQRAELDCRLDDLERDGPQGIPWEDVLRRIGDAESLPWTGSLSRSSRRFQTEEPS